MAILKWESPPPRRRALSEDNQAILDALKERPGEWAKVAEDAVIAKYNPLKVWGCKITSRGTNGGNAESIYVRFVGEEGEFDTPDPDDEDEQPEGTALEGATVSDHVGREEDADYEEVEEDDDHDEEGITDSRGLIAGRLGGMTGGL